MRDRGSKVAFMVLAGVLALSLGVAFGSASTPTPTATPTSGSGVQSEWTLVVDGLVQSPLSLTFGDLLAMPTTTVYAQLYCVGRPATPLAEGNWTGVSLAFILEQAGVSPEAVKVAFYADDGFTTDLTVTTAMRDDIILAYESDGEPLTEMQLVVPCKWGYKWILRLNHIELVDYDFLGTYESAGYSDEANRRPGDIDCDQVANEDDNCESVPNPDQANADGDAWGDACDNCPTAATPWYVPLGDEDCDGFTTADEEYVGTDPLNACPDNGIDDAWPPDINMDRWVNVLDLLLYPARGVLMTHAGDPNYDPRFDLNADSEVNVLDLLVFPAKRVLMIRCTP
jgi:hypothetical protein